MAATEDPIEQKLADQVYDRVNAAIEAKHLTIVSITTLIATAMAEAEKITTLNGEQKKELVVHVVSRLVDEMPADQEDREAIRATAAVMMPSIIDAIVAAASGQFGINGGQAGAGAGAGAGTTKCCKGCVIC